MTISNEDDDEIIAAINITPLVDIFLVMLIIFMITSTTFTESGISVSLPSSRTPASLVPGASELVIDKSGAIYLDDVKRDSADVLLLLRGKHALDSNHRVTLSADESLSYRDIVHVLDIVRHSGINKYALKVIERRD